MSSISLQHLVDGALTDAVTVRLVDETATYGVRFATTGATAVAASGTISPDPTGVYSYDTSALSVGAYEAAWQIPYPVGVYTYRHQMFSVDEAAPFTGVRLMDIEQELADRVGTYLAVESSANSTTGLLQSLELISSISLGEYSDLYLLRRGRTPDGTAIVPFNTSDRIRQVAEVNLANGQLVVDRAWATAPTEGEEVELHVLHPTRELRRAVIRGLRRCFFIDRLELTSLGVSVETNLTSSASWITNPSQVRIAEATPAAYTLPVGMPWLQPYTRGGSVWLKLAGYAPLGVLVTALRPASTYINGATSLAGPNDDDDVVAIDLEYATAAAHIELWRTAPARLLPGAQVGLQPSRKDVADEFTKISLSRVGRAPRSVTFSEPFGWASGNTIQVGG